ATGIAAKYLAREDATVVAILGCGWQAVAQVMAIREARPAVLEIRCYSPNAGRCAAFAQEMRRKTGVDVTAAAPGPEAVRHADVVLCATNSVSPVFFADWIEPGMHFSSIQHAEIGPDVLDKAHVAVTHYSLGGPAIMGSSKGITRAHETAAARQR